jgi:hypothetical protein
MVKLQRVKKRFFLTIPLDKILAKGWQGGENFDVNFGANGELVFKEIK